MGEDRPLVGRAAVVTGASAGIGRAIALALAARGANVVLAARRADRLREVAAEIEKSSPGVRALPVVADVSREEDVVRLAEAAGRELGAVDVLVSNAGRGYFARSEAIDAAKLEDLMRVNFLGAVLCVKHMVPGMVARRSGAVVLINSVSGKRGWAGAAPYVASKFALRGFAQCLWHEVHAHNVRVISVYPDYVSSEFYAAAGLKAAGLEKAIPPEDVAELVCGALRLQESTTVVELDVWPTSME
ncbi:MAG TPA: SDR family NAD(P)-dependent oxidoreductase [Vicinamibacteria bacterium]|nr:SDR family NAD(P)-dependent oxidoreductase [Vicinamibacteria bacterium]